ncbi:hypothetical protein FLA4_10070 [Candidatus Rickettsia kotlanii]|nr:hypothetical protein FLA4_10070 [Candidatus Rickettsia kotlanii]BDU61840.1 hypothetical protein HM2_10080 [Candidatus Rickettsia kotlanii]
MDKNNLSKILEYIKNFCDNVASSSSTSKFCMLKLPHPTKNFISNGYISIFCFYGGILFIMFQVIIFVPN